MVWRAEQSEPVRRAVALKLIRGGLDSGAILARFDAERQALALMDHPNIARVFDGGTTEAGQPFFVMELVAGIPVTSYCDEHRLHVRDRLELFVRICHAVQHAHQKGIIHRDLKPANVLVGEVDGVPTPKVIDFGVAKATGFRLTEQTLAEADLVVGTPSYMSPEQADPGSMDIDTRTDVYALGIILYELLVGSPPLDAERFRRGAVLEMLRMLRDSEPPRPSTKLSTAHDLASIAANRAIDPAALTRCLRGELDWVVMKALEKERARRYATASGFAQDVERYLADEPVEARPPSAAYRVRKFVRRHRVGVLAASAVVADLVLGIAGFAWQASVARDQRDRALHAETEARARAGELRQVADYQARMLQQVDATRAGVELFADLRARHAQALDAHRVPAAERPDRVRAFERELATVNATDAAAGVIDRAVLAPAALAIDTQFADQPIVDAALRSTLGVVYETLGRSGAALALHRRAYELRAPNLGAEAPDSLASRHGIAQALGELQQLDEADAIVRATLASREANLGPDHPDTLATRSLLAQITDYRGQYADCEALTRDVLERRRRLLGPDHVDTLAALSSLGKFMMNRGRYDDAVTLLRETLAAQRRVGDPLIANTLSHLGNVLVRMRDFAAAEPYLREALERRRRELGEDHPSTLTDVSNLATLLMSADRLVEAEPLAAEALAKSRRIHGDEHAHTLKNLNVVGQVLFRQGRFAEVEPYYREALDTGRRTLGEEHPDTIVWTSNLGVLMTRLGRLADAEALHLEALAKNRRQLGDAHPYTLTMVRNVVDLLRQGERSREAEPHLRRAIDAIRAERDDLGADGLALLGTFGSVLREVGEIDEAAACLEEVLAGTRSANGDDHANTVTAILRLANVRASQGRHADVLSLVDPIEARIISVVPGLPGVLRHASARGLQGVARAGLARDPAEFTLAEACLREAFETFAAQRGERDKETREWMQAFAALYTRWEGVEPGRGHAEAAAEWTRRHAESGR